MGFIENHSLKTFNAGDVIFHEDDPGKSMFIIRSGIVEILVKSGNKKVVIATLSDGAVFGEMALIDGRPRSAAVIAKTRTQCVEISQMMFQQKLDELPSWMQSFYQILVERLRDSAKKFGSAVTGDTGRQIIVLLDLLYQQNKAKVSDNSLIWKKAVEVIATILNIPFTHVDKVLNKLTITSMARSEISYDGRKLIIDDVPEFEGFAAFCRQKTQSKLGMNSLGVGSDFTDREEELIDFLRKLVKEQAGAPDLEEHYFKSSIKTELGKLFDEIKPEYERLAKKGIIKARRDSDGHKFFDVDLKKIRKIEEQKNKIDFFEDLEEKLK